MGPDRSEGGITDDGDGLLDLRRHRRRSARAVHLAAEPGRRRRSGSSSTMFCARRDLRAAAAPSSSPRIQVLVYAGAVMVLFLFVIMLLNLGHTESDLAARRSLTATVVRRGLLAVELSTLWNYSPRRLTYDMTARRAGLIRKLFAGGHLTRTRSRPTASCGGLAAPAFPAVPGAVRDHVHPPPRRHRRRGRPRQAEDLDAPGAVPRCSIGHPLHDRRRRRALRRNAIVLFMCVELMLNAVNLTLRRPGAAVRRERPRDGVLRHDGRRG